MGMTHEHKWIWEILIHTLLDKELEFPLELVTNCFASVGLGISKNCDKKEMPFLTYFQITRANKYITKLKNIFFHNFWEKYFPLFEFFCLSNKNWIFWVLKVNIFVGSSPNYFSRLFVVFPPLYSIHEWQRKRIALQYWRFCPVSRKSQMT